MLRFGNSIFEPLWNRNHVDYVEITAAETIGIEGRGSFYEQTGVVRDIIQNHLLQVMSLVTMEVPASFCADDIRDEKSQVLRSVRNLTLNDVANYAVRGQYRGYRERRRRAGLAGADLRGDAVHDRQLALARRAVLPARRQEARRARHRGRASTSRACRSCCSRKKPPAACCNPPC